MRKTLYVALAVLGFLIMLGDISAQGPRPPKRIEDDGMSPMGHRAASQARARARAFLAARGLAAPRGPAATDAAMAVADQCDDNGCDTGGDGEGPAGGQAELTIAIDSTGSHIVIGFNDTRGFSLNPISVSGFAYSDDGGATFVDGGQLPAPSNGQLANGTKLPQVFGDPDVKYLGGCTFIYSSIEVKGFSGVAPNFTGTAQTMGLHRSMDCGHTWTGPFEVTAATNPHGLLSGLNARDAADKEFLDVDPETGRVILTWSNFTSTIFIPGGVEIRTTFSDDALIGNPPTWSAGVVLNPGSATFDTGSMPRFAGNGSNNVYVAWASRSNTTGLSNTRVATSTNNGAMWGAPVTLNVSDFFPIDYILGNDRVHSFPGLAVGPEGNVYVVYANNNNHDGADVAFHRSTDGGVSFSTAALLNARPGVDRAQWFPYAAADANGRVYVAYYDQGVATSGDITEARFNFSDDGGLTWSKASALMSAGCVGVATDPLDCRPFHAGYGNDTGQPNLGDYIGATTFNGTLYAAWAATPRLASFTDGQPNPSGSFTVPDFYVNKVMTARAALAFGPMTFTESGGNGLVDAGDQVALKLPLSNTVTNAIEGPVTYTGITGTLSTSTPGVSILAATRTYPNIAPGGAPVPSTSDYVYRVSPTFVPGTKIEFLMTITTGQGSTTLRTRQDTGTPVATTIFSENFNGVGVGALPAGWGTIHAGGANTVPWTTNNTFCGTSSNALFHANANDGVGGTGNPARFERVTSPNITVPASAQDVTLDFDVCYDTEDDPGFNVLAYDGGLLRITDFTTGRVARAVLAEAFAEVITTGSFFHYPKHNPRSNSTAYFQDMSMWSGDSVGFKHVRMRLPGMEGSTVQLRPDFTQDSLFTCTDVRPTHTTCGIMIDNIVMKSIVTKSDELLKVSLVPVVGSPGVYTGTVTSQAVAPAGGILVNLTGSVSAGSITLTVGSVTIPAGSQTSPSFGVTVSPAASGTTGTVTATGPSNSRSAGIKIL